MMLHILLENPALCKDTEIREETVTNFATFVYMKHFSRNKNLTHDKQTNIPSC